MGGITKMKTNLLVNNNIIPLNDFTQSYIANILCGIARSLGDDSSNITICIEPEEIHISTEKGELDVKRDFVKQLIQSTIKGMLSPLKGIFWLQNITITSKPESELQAEILKEGLTDR